MIFALLVACDPERPVPEEPAPADTAADETVGPDADGDGWSDADDCDDADPAVHPEAYDACDDGVDPDCDGVDDPCRIEGDVWLGTADVHIDGPAFAGGAGDLDGDGLRDDVLAGTSVFLGPFGAEVDASAAVATLPGDASSIYGSDADVVGDIDGDGGDDVYVTDSDGAWLFAGPFSGEIGTSASVAVFAGRAGPAGDVDMDGLADVLVAGADQVYLYLATDWEAPALTLEAEDDLDGVGGVFDRAGDLDGDGRGDLVIGAPGWTNRGDRDRGSVYVVSGGRRGVLALADADFTWAGSERYMGLGDSVGSAGDHDGDGYDDVVATAFREGAVYVFSSTSTATHTEADAILTVDSAVSWGEDLSAGDWDGDGLDDLLISLVDAYGEPGGGEDAGMLLLFRGGREGAVTLDDADLRLSGESPGDHAGASANLRGDFDGDDYADAMVCSGAGVHLVLATGSATWDETVGPWTYGWLDFAWSRFGGDALLAADMDGDGDDELVSGNTWFNGRGGDDTGYPALAGGAAIAELPVTGDVAWDATTPSLYAEFVGGSAGSALAAPGDVTGDGWPDLVIAGDTLVYLAEGPFAPEYRLEDSARLSGVAADALALLDLDADGVPELLVGVPSADGVGRSSGAVYLQALPFTGEVDITAAPALAGDAEGQRAGVALLAEDLDGDGVGDLLVGAYAAGTDYAGRVYVFYAPGLATGSLADADAVLEGPGAHGYTGWSVAVGDTTGDGALELLVGSPQEETFAVPGGSVRLAAVPASGTSDLEDESMAVLHGVASSDEVGLACAAADYDGDGFADVSVAANGHDARIGTFRGPVSGTFTLDDADTLVLGETGGVFGEALLPFDVDGDGLDDLVFGSPEGGGVYALVSAGL